MELSVLPTRVTLLSLSHSSSNKSPLLGCVPQLSPELTILKKALGKQLQILRTILSNYNAEVLNKAAEDYKELHRRFLKTLVKYCNTALVSLFPLTGVTSRFLQQYKLEFPDFLHYSERTIQELVTVVENTETVLRHHSTTLKELDDVAFATEDAVNKHCAQSKLLWLGTAVGCALLTFVEPPTGVLATGAFAANIMDQMKASKALRGLGEIIKEMETPIRAIHIKLDDNKENLKILEQYNTNIVDLNDPEDIRKRQYALAQQEAIKIDEVCQEIRRFALDFEMVRNRIALRLEQMH